VGCNARKTNNKDPNLIVLMFDVMLMGDV
jgi:hypothetical protein